jgi:undecaprenyl-diphosphatase
MAGAILFDRRYPAGTAIGFSMDRLAPHRQNWIGRLSAAELRIVHVAYARSRLAQGFAIAVNRLGNGWLYLILALVCFALEGTKIFPVILAAALSAGLAHCVYPRLKTWWARPRPCNVDPALKHCIPALDEYSFPSGHFMTLTVVLVPLVLAFPYFLIAAIVLWVAMAWASISLAHHYPSDVIAGGALGVAISAPISFFVL